MKAIVGFLAGDELITEPMGVEIYNLEGIELTPVYAPLDTTLPILFYETDGGEIVSVEDGESPLL